MTFTKCWIMIQVLEVPDLTLAKYNTAGMQGSGSLLEFHDAFLRQWHMKGVLTETSIHLFYKYNPLNEPGTRMETYLGFYNPAGKIGNAAALIVSSSLMSEYKYKILTDEEIEAKLGGELYEKSCMMTKREKSLVSSLDQSAEYYTVADWKPNENGRLRQVYNLLKALNESVLLRIDLYPLGRNSKYRMNLMKQIDALRMRAKRDSDSAIKDQASDLVIKSYEEQLKDIDNSPLFRANLFCFGAEYLDGSGAASDSEELILDTMAAESIETGDCQIVKINTRDLQLSSFSFLDDVEKEYTGRETSEHKEKKLERATDGGWEIYDAENNSKSLRFLPTVFSLEQSAPLFRLPVLEEHDAVEIRKETYPAPGNSENSLFLGNDDRNYPVYFPLDLLTKHAFIAGVPGSGKTNLMLHLTTSMWLNKAQRIPFLVFEPAKKEYRALLNQKGMEDVFLFSPNAAMKFPLHINPFEFPKGLMLSEHIRQLEEVFEGAFPLDNPMPFLLDTAIEAVYRECGWEPDMINDGDKARKFPTMSMLYNRLEMELKKTEYSSEVSGNLKSALQVRIGSLLRREMGEVFDTPDSTFSPEEWINKAAIIELEAMGSGPANFMTLLLCALIRETLKVQPSFSGEYARHVIFIEEAHNLIGPTAIKKDGVDADPKMAATSFIVKMLAEVRALKEGIVIADQLPTVMAPEVIKNTGFKVGLRITSSDDRELLCSTMAANAVQMESMATYNKGRALITYEGLKKPFELQTHEWLNKGDEAYIEDKELRNETKNPKSDNELVCMMADRTSYKETIRKDLVIKLNKLKRNHVRAFFGDINRFNDYYNKYKHKRRDPKEVLEEIMKEMNFKGDPEEFIQKTINSTLIRIKKIHKNVTGIHQRIEDFHMNEYDYYETDITNARRLFYSIYTTIKSSRIIYRDLGIMSKETDEEYQKTLRWYELNDYDMEVK